MASECNWSLQTYAHDFFDQHKEFVALADKVGDSSFFITGGTGLFGCWVLSFFDWAQQRKLADPKICILVRRQLPLNKKGWRVILGDISNFEYESVVTDYVLHMAAPTARETFQGMGDMDKFDMLTRGAKHVLNFSRERTRERTLMLSSGAIYGGFGSERCLPISEIDCHSPSFKTPNQGLAIGKRATEFLTKAYADAAFVDASVARCFSFVGPGLPVDIHYAVGNFVHQALVDGEIIIKGDGKPIRSYMYLGDMVLWLLRILMDGVNGEDYNVGSNESISILDLAKKVVQLSGGDAKITLLGHQNQTSGNPPNQFYVPDINKCRQELDLRPLFDLEESLKRYIAYNKQMMCR
ncbi:NAD(P)-dependent oxidoreductase [Alphaproteobacteria bacterium]|nr:NAD(P)-dependent oxidoreductase [Alphaproteobacteria bacterium]